MPLANTVREADAVAARLVRDRRAIGDWLRDVDELCASVRRGLAPLLGAKLVAVTDPEFWVIDPPLGSYSARGVEITLLSAAVPRVVLVRPRGMSILGAVETGVARALGARGRVDIECAGERAILLRFEDRTPVRWVSFSRAGTRSFDEKAFLGLLSQVTESKLK